MNTVQTAEPMTVDLQTAAQIQSKIAEYAQSHDVYADGITAPYSEGFYDNCIVFWEEAGYDAAEVREAVEWSPTCLLR